jgi:uncharacterized membrane protein
MLSTDPPPAVAESAPVPGWTLRRRLAITPRAFMQAYAIHGVISAAIAVCFGVMQLWVIVAFCIIQVGVVSACYVHFALHAFDGESIVVAPDGTLDVAVVRGRTVLHHRFNPAWTRVERGGRRDAAVFLCSGSQRVEVGHFLTPGARRALELELRRTLRKLG